MSDPIVQKQETNKSFAKRLRVSRKLVSNVSLVKRGNERAVFGNELGNEREQSI
jgi:hypothetical protein